MATQDILADLAILGQYFMEVSMQVARDARRAFEAEILLGEVLEKMTEEYVWEWPDPTVSELRRFVERDFGLYLVNALRDVGVTLGFMTPISDCPPVSAWLNQAEKLTTIPEEIKERLLHIDGARYAASHTFPSLNRMELDIARRGIVDAMGWLRTEFPAAGVEYLPDDFGS